MFIMKTNIVVYYQYVIRRLLQVSCIRTPPGAPWAVGSFVASAAMNIKEHKRLRTILSPADTRLFSATPTISTRLRRSGALHEGNPDVPARLSCGDWPPRTGGGISPEGQLTAAHILLPWLDPERDRYE